MSNETKIALVTGAGSGIGRAAALSLARDGWTAALAGRRREALEETADLIAGETVMKYEIAVSLIRICLV